LLLPIQLRAADTIKGNIENGKAIAEKQCDRCHGSGGVSDDPDTPHLAAQSAAYTLKQLGDYKTRTRDDKNMYKRARKLDEQQMTDIALWYQSQSLPELNPLALQDLEAPQLVSEGDPARAIPPCELCHGKDGKTVAGEIPVLAGQQFDYLLSTMEYFRDGSRSNDPGGAVQIIIRKLSDVEIEALARYYAALGGRPAE
jgi:cytochrome c553